MSSSSVNRVSLMDSVVLRPRAEAAATDCSVNICCSRSICRCISATRRSLFSRCKSERLRSSSLSRSRRSCSSAISRSRRPLSSAISLSRCLDHDPDHLREAGELRQGATHSPLTFGGCVLGVSALILHSFVGRSGSGCHKYVRIERGSR